MAVLPPEAVLGFNVGNEPDLYPKLYKLFFTYFTSSSGYFADIANYTAALKPILLQYFGTTKMIAGEDHGTWFGR